MKTQHITKDKFEVFKKIRQSGVVNMHEFNSVIIIARSMHKVKLTKDECFDIFRNYMIYEKQFNCDKS